jgi:hypothetical protein
MRLAGRGADTRVCKTHLDALSCGRQSCLQAAFQAAFSIRDEFLGLSRFHAEAIPRRWATCARLDKLKHVLPKNAETSVGATPEAMTHWRKWPKPKESRRGSGLLKSWICHEPAKPLPLVTARKDDAPIQSRDQRERFASTKPAQSDSSAYLNCAADLKSPESRPGRQECLRHVLPALC